MTTDHARRQDRLYSEIWAADPNYGTAYADVIDTVVHRIAPHIRRQPSPIESCADFGAGDGRFLRAMIHQGLVRHGIGVDLYEPPDLDGLGWLRMPLWDAAPRTDYVISTDALEHMPTEKVPAVLERIAKCAPHGFLRISTRQDRYGTERGLHLHETVERPSWWLAQCQSAGIQVTDYKVYIGRAAEIWW
jgi:hypothetical protein